MVLHTGMAMRVSFEEQLILVRVDVLALHVVLAFVVEHPFALVAREEPVAAGEGVARHIATVLAAVALELLRFVVGEGKEVVYLADGTIGLCVPVISRRMQRTAIGPHQLGHIGTCHLRMGKQFEGTHNGVVSHRSALHNYLLPEIVARMQF